MHPLFTEILAKQHMEQLHCEAQAERNAAQLEAHSRRLEVLEGAAVQWHSLGLLRLYWVRVVGLFGRAVIIYQVKSDVRKHGEVQQELQMIANPMISGCYEATYHRAIPSEYRSSRDALS
jgi:hypothetical protein